MNKRDVAATLKREIDYRLGLIDDCQKDKLDHLSTPALRRDWMQAQLTCIHETNIIASKLHIDLRAYRATEIASANAIIWG
jgi:hypothetical protein